MVELEIVSDTRSDRWSLVLAAVVVIWYVAAVVVIPKVEYKSHKAQVKQNLHTVQLALERFAVDSPDNSYPLSLQELQVEGYMREFPSNPFAGRPMRGAVYVWRSDLTREENEARIPRQAKGDFVYIQRFYGESGSPRPVGYTLVAY